MRRINSLTQLLVILMLFSSACAQQPDITVGESVIPPLAWGEQQATFELTNNTNSIKFIRAHVEVSFKGLYLNPSREIRTNTHLAPLESKKISVDFDIPPNYGKADVKIFLYDVIDTLDEILTGQLFFEQPAVLYFRAPEGMQKYVSEKITMPPRVDAHPDFDHEFSRSLLFMLNDGMSVAGVAKAAETDTFLVADLLDKLYANGYARAKQEGISLTFPVIGLAEAEESRQLALTMSVKLATEIEKNMPAYRATIDSLVKVGLVSADRYEFMDGGAILYHAYPVIGTLLLWVDLGQKFITRSAPLLIYDNTDPCMANIPYYMYAVEGGDTFNGSHFFAMSLKPNAYVYHFGDSIPVLQCQQTWERGRRIPWHGALRPESKYTPDMYMVDTLATAPAVAALRGNAAELLPGLYADLLKIAVKHGHEKLLFGYRYWVWNLIATRTLETLVDRGVVTRKGNGQFRMDGRTDIGKN